MISVSALVLFFLSSEKNPNRAINTGDFRGNVSNVFNFQVNPENDFSEKHNATFSVHIPIYYIANFSKKNDIIIDPFGGSGTTMIACEKTNRKCRMIEIDEKYCDVIIKRWEDYTGKKAELLQ